MSRILSTQEVETQFRKIHGDKYTYDWSTYINNKEKMIIICKEHGKFKQLPHTHKMGQGCPKCGKIKKAKTTTLSFEDFTTQCRKVHGHKYTYFKESYVNITTKTNINCPIHGEFKQRPCSHKIGQGCPICKNIKNAELKRLTTEKQEIIFNKVHNFKYAYDWSTYINNSNKMTIICPIHGKFEQSPNRHKTGSGCPKCNSSKGELKINEYLLFNENIFKSQYKFFSCRNNRKLIFDFYLPELNTCIEFDGIQHFQFTPWFHTTQKVFKHQQLRHKVKPEYCKANGIKLIRIPYTEFENIDSILERELF